MRMISVALCLGVLSACGGDESASAPDPSVPAVEVSSVELGKAFEANEVAAQQTYGSSPLLVSGTVEGIQLDLMDEPVVLLTGLNEFSSIQASFAGDASAATSALSKGDQIVLRCGSVSELIGTPMLDDCVIE